MSMAQPPSGGPDGERLDETEIAGSVQDASVGSATSGISAPAGDSAANQGLADAETAHAGGEAFVKGESPAGDAGWGSDSDAAISGLKFSPNKTDSTFEGGNESVQGNLVDDSNAPASAQDFHFAPRDASIDDSNAPATLEIDGTPSGAGGSDLSGTWFKTPEPAGGGEAQLGDVFYKTPGTSDGGDTELSSAWKKAGDEPPESSDLSGAHMKAGDTPAISSYAPEPEATPAISSYAPEPDAGGTSLTMPQAGIDDDEGSSTLLDDGGGSFDVGSDPADASGDLILDGGADPDPDDMAAGG